jgi:hypothetical protein
MVSHAGEIWLHRTMNAAPEPLLQAMAPSRDGLVVAVEGLFTGYWLADLCAPEGLAFVLGPALSMQAIHGGKAKHAQIAAQKLAALRRGGRLPPASVYPAAMRATRDLVRRRTHLLRTRAERLAHVQQTTSQDHLPKSGTKIAYHAHRHGVAERCDEPAVPKHIAVDRGLITYDDARLTDLARSRVKPAPHHDAHTFSRLRSIPGVGNILALVLRDDMHAMHRCPRVQDVVSYGRLVQGAREAAGTRAGTAGKHIGTAPLTWACSEAAVRFLRPHPAGQQHLASWANTPGQGQALTVRAHTLARAVYDMLTRDTVFHMDQGVPGSREQRGCAWRLTGHRRDAPVFRTLTALFGGVGQHAGVHRPCIPEPWPWMGRPLWRLSRRR